jgi:hypothetical protein
MLRGIHDQFCVQMETSSRLFQTTGVARMPAVAPPMNFRKPLLSRAIAPPLYLWQTKQALLELVTP